VNPLSRLAKGWLAIGLAGFSFVTIFAVAVFVFGAPIHNQRTGELLSASQSTIIILLMGAGFAFFVILGALLWRGLRKRSR
jgi:hypothetical protein